MLKTGKKLLGSVCFHGWIVKERNGKLHFLQVDRWKGFGAENEIPLSGPTETARKGNTRKWRNTSPLLLPLSPLPVHSAFAATLLSPPHRLRGRSAVIVIANCYRFRTRDDVILPQTRFYLIRSYSLLSDTKSWYCDCEI